LRQVSRLLAVRNTPIAPPVGVNGMAIALCSASFLKHTSPNPRQLRNRPCFALRPSVSPVVRASDTKGGLNCVGITVEIVMMMILSGSNRRFAMSAWKPLALGIVVWAASSSVVQADPISSPNQFNWVVYFAGGNGNAPVPISSTPSTNTIVAPQPSTPPQAPSQTAPTQPAPYQPAPYQAAPYQPAPSQAAVSTAQSLVANAPVAQPSPAMAVSAPSMAPSSGKVDAFINLGTGPYPLANSITTGNAQPWYNSSQLTSLFGGQPTAQQIQSFDSTILQRVQQTFSQSGVSVTLTDNPNVPALHTLSLVSNTSSSSLSSAIGMTQVGSSGFSFINNIAPSAQSVDQLEWIVAHNISHELMLAFGVPENYDQTGNYVDSKVANWAMMVSPNSTFSPAASQALNQALASESITGSAPQLGAQSLTDTQVPEPATLAIWALAGAALLVARRRSVKSRTSLQAQPH
jgi:hypothetical protein